MARVQFPVSANKIKFFLTPSVLLVGVVRSVVVVGVNFQSLFFRVVAIGVVSVGTGLHPGEGERALYRIHARRLHTKCIHEGSI